jgi:alpha-L-fucosidase 2
MREASTDDPMPAHRTPWRQRLAPAQLGQRLSQSRTGSVLRVLRDLRTPLPEPPDAPHYEALSYAPPHRLPWARAPRVDVYLPEGEGPFPSIIWVHGGGFTLGRRHMKPMRHLTTMCRRAGFAVASIDYRLLGRGGRLSEGVADVQAAWSWWLGQAERFNLDPKRVALGGLSAGGCLSLLAAEGLIAQGGPTPVCMVAGFALYDLGELDRGMARLLSRLVGGKGGSEARRTRSPVGRPALNLPILALHGDADAVVPVAQAKAWLENRRHIPGLTRYLELSGAEHGFFNDPDGLHAQRGTEEILQWLRQHLMAAP